MRYELVRSNRKTLALTVDRDGRLTVRAPLHLPVSQIEAFVMQKQEWIEKTQARLKSLPPRATRLTLREGESLPYLGRTLSLHLAAVRRVACQDGQLMVPQNAQSLAPVVCWLEDQARHELQIRTRAQSQALGLTPGTLRLSRAHGRWGSMSTRGTISLNRSLIFCPPEVIDYVIVHELCHIAHPNHSAAFWARVAKHCPNYRALRDWLKTHSSLIFIWPDASAGANG